MQRRLQSRMQRHKKLLDAYNQNIGIFDPKQKKTVANKSAENIPVVKLKDTFPGKGHTQPVPRPIHQSPKLRKPFKKRKPSLWEKYSKNIKEHFTLRKKPKF